MDLKRVVPGLVLLGILAGVSILLPALVARVSYARASAQVRALRDGLGGLGQADTLSGLFHTVADSVRPAVVVIRTSERVEARQPDVDTQDFLRHFFGEQTSPEEPRYYVREGIGSGIIIDAANGYVLTNRHVVRGAQTADVILADGRVLRAEWARADPHRDLAIVKIEPDRLISAPLANSDDIQVGDLVLAIGAPEALPQTVTSGIVSAKVRVSEEDHQSFIQTDAAINPGNSGGPLVNMKGHVVGINTAIISPVGVNAGIGLAIPSNVAKKTMTQLIEAGSP
jgi:serine protease DegQ